jgi:hypothetical protein
MNKKEPTEMGDTKHAAKLEDKLCQRFKKVIKDIDTLWFMFSIYVGECQIERGDVFTHEEVFKRLCKRIKNGKRVAK